MKDGRNKMKITYDSKYDVLYLKFVEGKKQVINKHLTDDIAVDIDEKGKIVGMEFLEASEHIDLGKLLPVKISAKAYAKSA